MARDFVHLHVHSDYSLLDGACKHDRLLELARRCDMGALAVTDHGNLFGAMEFYQRARKAGVKPILGCEVYTVPGDDPNAHRRKEKGYNHLVLLCKDAVGFANLSKLVSKGFLEGFYYKPRVSRALLREHREGLICLTACLKGEPAQHILNDRIEAARRSIEELREIYGEDDLYLELQRNGLEIQEKVNRGLIELGREMSLPLVGTFDVHYLRPEDKLAHDVLCCVNTGKLLSDPNRLRIEANVHFRTKEEAAEEFAGLEAALDATVAIAERCNVELDTSRKHLPVYEPKPSPGGAAETPAELFARLCEEGARARYPADPRPSAVQERLDMEMEVIRSMGFESYFLIVWDFIDWAKRQGIPVGPGRGSAAGSIVAYSLGITDIDPLKYDLLFERFLNKERVSMPDIDVDFCQERRQEVIAYTREKYGHDAVSQIITFGTMAARSAVRDVCRVMDIPLAEADRVAKLIPADLQVKRKKLGDALADVPELAELIESDARFREVFDIVAKLEGAARNCSTHAAGVVIGDGPLIERVPLYRDPKSGELVTQYTMGLLEDACGLLKMDFLGLRTLTVIKWCLDQIQRTTGRRPSVSKDDLPLDEVYPGTRDGTCRRTYELLQRGETKGVFQFESQGYRDLLVRLKPDKFGDIIALGAMYRPGPLGAGMVDAYVNRKHGREEVTYEHPLLEQVLGETYGCMLYQEQVMRITNVLAGFSLNEADTLRKAMGKKKLELMARFRGQFLDGAEARGCARPVAEKIWEQMAFFAGYGFNKSHSTAYALVTFQTAWLKANYPAEFMAALLSSEVRAIDKVVEYIDECRRMGIEVLGPDVNESEHNFTVVKDARGQRRIRYGLIAIKGVGDGPVAEILRARERKGPFRTLFDLCCEVETKLVNRAVLEALIRAGACSGLEGSRAQQLEVLEKALSLGSRLAADRRAGQRSLFGGFGAACEEPAPSPPLPDVPELSEKELLAAEKETLGFYLTTHPLNTHRERLRRYATTTARALAQAEGDVLIGGLVTGLRTRQDRKGNLMAFLTVEDLEGSFDAVVFSRTFAAVREHLREDAVILIRGSVDTTRELPSVLVDDVIPLDQADRALAVEVQVRVPKERVCDDVMQRLANVMLAHRGHCPVTLVVETQSGLSAQIRIGRDHNVTAGPDLEAAIDEVVGEGACRICGGMAGRTAASQPRAPAAEAVAVA